MPRIVIVTPLLLLLAGCGAGRGAIEGVANDPRIEPQEKSSTDQRPTETESAESAIPDLTQAEAIPSEAEKVIWQWLDANIGSQERLAASLTGQRLSGADVGREMQVSSAQKPPLYRAIESLVCDQEVQEYCDCQTVHVGTHLDDD